MGYHTKFKTLVPMFNSPELFCVINDFFLKFEAIYWQFLKKNRDSLGIRTAQLTISEVCFIAIWYKCSQFNNFKAFFTWFKKDKSHFFKSLPCYQRMIHLINMHQLALHALHVSLMKGQDNNIYGLIQPHYQYVKTNGFNVINH